VRKAGRGGVKAPRDGAGAVFRACPGGETAEYEGAVPEISENGVIMRYSSALAAAALLAAAQTGAAQQWETIETFGGAWDTNWGEVWAMPSGPSGYEGNYTEDNGRFVLEFTGHVFEGYWAEDMADQRCDRPVLGSYYWGRLELGNSNSYPGFQMLWGYCDHGRVDKVWTFKERLPDGM